MPTTISDIEKAIDDLGYGTPEYHEAMAFYCMMLARSQWRRADMIRKANHIRDVKGFRAKAKK